MDSYGELDHWWGAAGAVACGLGMRYGETIVGYAGVAGAVAIVGACLVMLLDAFTQ